MKSICFFLLLFSTEFSLAQPEFANQIKNIVADSANNFHKFISTFKQLQDKDSVFYSNLNIDGTKSNDILFTKQMALYKSTVTDAIKENKGKRLVDEWVQKIKSILDDSFTLEKTKIVEWNPSRYGWKFSRGNLLISVDLYPYNSGSDNYWICLGVTHFSSAGVE